MSAHKARLRTCISCRAKSHQNQLIRLAAAESGGIQVLTKSPLRGRSAYVCARSTCIDTLGTRGRLERALRLRVLPTTLTQLVNELQECFGFKTK